MVCSEGKRKSKFDCNLDCNLSIFTGKRRKGVLQTPRNVFVHFINTNFQQERLKKGTGTSVSHPTLLARKLQEPKLEQRGDSVNSRIFVC